MTSVTLLGELDSQTSGQARFLFNIAMGLSKSGISVSVVLRGRADGRGKVLQGAGVNVVSLPIVVGSISGRVRRMTRFNDLGRRVGEHVERSSPTDWYVVLSDDLVSAVRYRAAGRWAYLSNGDMALLLLSRAFVAGGPLSRGLTSLGAADLIRSHSRDAERYDLLLANSEFTRRLMSYLYGVPFQGTVYPPVDRESFRPGDTPPSSDYVLVVARSRTEQNLAMVEELARKVPIRIVGGATVRGTHSLGRVPDSSLRELYRNAAFLAFPIVSEPFGYAVAEALACGTPSLVFDSGGPGEIVDRTGCGWAVKSKGEFVSLASRLVSSGYDQSVRKRCVSASELFSVESSTRSLTGAMANPGVS